MARKLYIRPRYDEKGQVLKGFVLSTTNGDLLVDSQILEHFDARTTGKEIRECAKEFHNADDVEWGKCL